MTKIKICGLKTAEDIKVCSEMQVDYCGFVFYAASPRYVTTNKVSSILNEASYSFKAVALFVNPSDDELSSVISNAPIDIIQLHGNESIKRVEEIATKYDKPIIKACPVKDALNTQAYIDSYASISSILFDAPASTNDTRPGGNAKAFAWNILRECNLPDLWFLAGGLAADNIDAACKITRAPAVDVSSGVEKSLGNKDQQAIRNFVNACRNS